VFDCDTLKLYNYCFTVGFETPAAIEN